MRIIPAIIIFTSVCLALGGARAAAQEPPVTPTATPVTTGSITIAVETNPEGGRVEFEADNVRRGTRIRDFTRVDDRTRVFRNLEPGRYEFTPDLTNWEFERWRCNSYRFVDDDEAELEVRLEAGVDIVCTLYVKEKPVATPTPSPTSVPLVATQTPVVITRERVVTVVATPTPVAVVGSAVTTIRPPSTGDGGLR